MKTLVIGGTGTVGSEVVNQLLTEETGIVVLTRSSDNFEKLPEGVEGVVGDLLQPKTLRSIFKEVDRVFMLNAVSPTECSEGLMALLAAKSERVKKIVYLSVHNVDDAPHLPHFGAKIPIEQAIKETGIDYTILRANNFYQNDYWFKDAILQYGVYPQPIGDVGLSRVDIRDIAEAAAIALTTDQAANEILNLVGPEVLTGEQTAEIWSEALDKSISYGGNDLDSWEEQMLQYMPDWMVYDFRHMYAYFQEHGLKAGEGDVERLTELLGHEPVSFKVFAKQTAIEW
ncbi:NmrA family NAD(P)-binding protein [Balneolaceae bacterium YR4-1]|uniref:NmrA family NAD(P)-binding protein n=1 Tax=Halalkalibaculum roseum TaxID=2709311 RepID=A0A6M1T1D2_9BACT|nr:NmrA family NAD(P)-binding protein [Halalkalibaculum roseum]NGP77906.1 NmrA family NAD(P)-binding protein [Halalkalibaculum roseum]